MKKQILSFIFLAFAFSTFAQQPSTDKQNMQVLTNSEPVYPKGDKVLYSYVMYNTKYPVKAKEIYLEGEVMLSFDVKADSTVSNIIVISGVGYGVDEEVKKLIQTLKFVPAVQNGIPVKMNTMYTFPVKAY